MSRLTEKVDNEKLLEADIRYLTRNQDGIYAVLNKLGELEDLEEQGRLIEQKHGHWIKSRKYYDDGYTVIGACSVCGLEFQAKLLRKICYCPHCGAKMDEVEK